MDLHSKFNSKEEKCMIIVSGIPASGKSFFAKQLCEKISSNQIEAKIFSTDNLEAFFFENPAISFEEIKVIFSENEWNCVLGKFSLNKKKFDEKAWNTSRKTIENPEILDLLFKTCQILIIEDELVLKSQRKPFKRYCFEKNIKQIEFEIETSLEEAYENNKKRGELSENSKVTNEIIKKSYEKYEHNEDSVVLDRKKMKEFLEFSDIYSYMKNVQIQDNYSEYLLKQSVEHEFTVKELDENELRKLINLIMKDEKESGKYFKNPIESKEKATILAHAKKSYIDKKRKVPFIEILNEFIEKQPYKDHK